MAVYLIPFFHSVKRISSLFLISFLLIFIGSESYPCSSNSYSLKTVVIDPGHGGKDFGAIGKNGKEKDIVLSVALKLGHYIENKMPDVKVIYTRSTDVFIPLIERAEIANKNDADLFISIHVNSNPSPTPYGVETYAMGLHKSEENLQVAQAENSAILYEDNYSKTYEGFDPKSAESYIIFNLLQNAYLEQSIKFASIVQDEIKEKRHNRGVRQAGFLVLWKTTMPSVLIETGFISNSKEEKYLLTDDGQDYIANSIFRAFKSYKSWYDNQNNNEKNQDTIVTKDTSDKIKITDNKNTEISQPEDSIVIFKVQISASKKIISVHDPFFKGLPDIEVMQNGGSVQVYYWR